MRTTSLCLAIVFSLALSAAHGANGIQDEAGKHLDILRDGKPLVRYMYERDTSTPEKAHETYKCYHHVFDPAGKEFITKGPGGQYTHHRGIFLGWSKLGHDGKRYDHWHMSGVTIVHQKFVEQKADDKAATVTSVLHWNDREGKPILEETRTLTVHFTDDAHLLTDFETQLKAVNGDVELRGDPEHAGVQYRPSDEVSKNKSAKYTFHAEGIDPHKDKDLPWVALTYKLGEQLYTVQHMRHPSDPTDSVYSAYRNYGRFGNYFVAPIADGSTLTLRYRLRITLGDAPSREELAKQFDAYVK
jgi:hypothetical protein